MIAVKMLAVRVNIVVLNHDTQQEYFEEGIVFGRPVEETIVHILMETPCL